MAKTTITGTECSVEIFLRTPFSSISFFFFNGDEMSAIPDKNNHVVTDYDEYMTLAYPCAESVNIKNGFGVGHDVDTDGLGLRVLTPCGHCGGNSSTASVSSDSALSRRKQLHAHGISAMSSAETVSRKKCTNNNNDDYRTLNGCVQ